LWVHKKRGYLVLLRQSLDVVELEGVEPSSKQAAKVFSTRLVSVWLSGIDRPETGLSVT